jgi:hypothetical protein
MKGATHMRANKRRMLESDDNPLADEWETEPDDEVTVEESEPAPTNGHGPAYVETEDEDELRSLITNIDDTMEEVISIPEWQEVGADGTPRIVRVLIRGLLTHERTSLIKQMQKNGGDITKLYSDLCILCARHPKTKRHIFRTADRGMLDRKMGKAIERMATKAVELSGLSPDFLEELKKK